MPSLGNPGLTVSMSKLCIGAGKRFGYYGFTNIKHALPQRPSVSRGQNVFHLMMQVFCFASDFYRIR